MSLALVMAHEPVIWPMSLNTTAASLDAISPLQELPPADCKHPPFPFDPLYLGSLSTDRSEIALPLLNTRVAAMPTTPIMRCITSELDAMIS